MEARGILKVYADALGARAHLLDAVHPLGPESRALVEAVEAYHVAADALVSHATSERERTARRRCAAGSATPSGRANWPGSRCPRADPFA